MYSTKFYVKPNASNTFVNTSLNVTKNRIPFLDFDDDDILNIYIPRVPILGDININLTTGNTIYTESNIKALYAAGAKFLQSNISNNSNKKFVVTYQKSDSEIEVIYFADRFKATNTNKIKHKFYSDLSFKIGYTELLDGSGSSSFSVGPSSAPFRDYTHYELDFYGMARKGSAWKGNRMIR